MSEYKLLRDYGGDKDIRTLVIEDHGQEWLLWIGPLFCYSYRLDQGFLFRGRIYFEGTVITAGLDEHFIPRISRGRIVAAYCHKDVLTRVSLLLSHPDLLRYLYYQSWQDNCELTEWLLTVVKDPPEIVETIRACWRRYS